VTPLTAALLNSAFIQGIELDDYHPGAPIHSGSIIVPVLLALTEHLSMHGESFGSPRIDGNSFLLAATAGYEIGPRIGLALYGIDVLTNGWHSGAVFGPAAAAAAASKLLNLRAEKIEDAIGIACTQAGGLMSAQYESMVKRMQHGFAARNGLFAALMTAKNYTGIKQVLERPYGGFLSNFSRGNKQTPANRPDCVIDQLGKRWEIAQIVVKPYASMAATHVPIDCVRALQEDYPALFAVGNLHNISKITVEMSEPALKKGGWKAKKPITMTGAQMNTSYAMALQLLDNQVTIAQFLDDSQLNRQEIWSLIDKIECVHNPDFNATNGSEWSHLVSIWFGKTVKKQKLLLAPRSQTTPVSKEEILEKWRVTTNGILTYEEQRAIESEVLDLENSPDITRLVSLLLEAGGRLDAKDNSGASTDPGQRVDTEDNHRSRL
jgi:aconitate decarboxylase